MQSSQEVIADSSRYILQVYVGALSVHYEALSVEASKQTTAEEIVSCIVERLCLRGNNYELAEVAGECKERRLASNEKPVSVMLLWPMHSDRDFHRFYLRESQSDVSLLDSYGLDSHIFREFIPFLLQPENREYPDLCQLTDLNETTLLDNLRQRFENGYIYTYVGSILIAVNPFKFYPIYNPKYVRLYQNQRIGPIRPPHIFAIADNAYYSMVKENRNQCIVISGESGSGKTESTNFLLHHLTALSQKGSHGSGVEQTILSAGPVLEAFGNAKTAHNNNSSRFGKFIQVNYRENGMVQGAVVQKYLLEKSRIVSQGTYERNYHVFYYLLSGASESERELLHLVPADKYHYLNSKNLTLENCDEKYEFSRLKQSMEMVGFSAEKQRRLFNVLSAVLLLGNVEFFPKKSTYHHDESVQVRNLDVVSIISELLKVKQDTLLAALTSKRVKASGETLIMQYKLPEAIAARDALAKCLYGALFEWIVLQVNHALLNKDQTPHTGHSIGVLDIFGFEDFGTQNSFEQLCINYANEHLQYYFNLHVFKYEQNEYKREGIKWSDIEFMDNSGCLHLFEAKPTGLLCILDDLCNFPGATNETLLQKFNTVNKDNKFYEKPQRKENAFIIIHYAGHVKYQVTEMREKNLDLMRQDIVSVLKNSSMAFVRELVGADPVAVFRWAIIRAFFRSYFAFRHAGIKHRKERNDVFNKIPGKNRFRQHNEVILSHLVTVSTVNLTINRIVKKNPILNEIPNSSSSTVNHQCNIVNRNSSRRSWSSIAFNNKNFPDGKLVYETNQIGTNEIVGSKMFSKNYLKFERSSQDVMARASQIVQKNKSFRPRERPKKGLKNLQTVKMMTAGANSINQSGIKTRKQPQTVTAQFQNSLSLLMDTLNQANPYFIRCIKSNSQKIPNKFDDVTVVRQLRYTGMLETVRIRRAGYNVRVTYEEFIQLYRMLLPKGLVSSQRDVKDFLNTMELNRQHYQLGGTKIFMRESQKTRLDNKLHMKIIDSIVLIQRWFRGILERKRFLILKSAVITLQSFWRMYLAQKYTNLKKHQINAVIVIQATWRMYKIKNWYIKLKKSLPVIQAHCRGYLTRNHYKYIKNAQRERNRLTSTQSLPNSEKAFRSLYNVDDILPTSSKVYSSLDGGGGASSYNTPNEINQQIIPPPNSTSEIFLKSQDHDVLQKASNQLRSLIISSGNNNNNNRNLGFINESSISTTVPSETELIYPPIVQNPNEILFGINERDSSTSLHKKPYDNSAKNFQWYNDREIIQNKDSGPPYEFNTDDDMEEIPLTTIKSVHHKKKTNLLKDEEFFVLTSSKPNTQKYIVTDTYSPPTPPIKQNIMRSRDISHRHHNDELNSNYTKTHYENININPADLSSSTSSHHQYPSKSSQSTCSSYMKNSQLIDEEKLTTNNSSSNSGNSGLTPKGKAAALLGSISEDQNPFNLDNRLVKVRDQKRRIRTNYSDDLTRSIAMPPYTLKSTNEYSSPDSLKRRNSDPSTNKISLLDANRGNDMYQSSTQINIAGHRFRKAGRIGKAEQCASCEESDAFVNEGYRCLDCKVLVHTKCIQNGGVKTLLCEAKRSKRLRKNNTDKPTTPNSKYSGTREYKDSTDRIISDAKELNLMYDFITQKIYKMDATEREKSSEVDRVFKKALRAFKDNLVTQYSVAHKQNSDSLNIKYRDLIDNFGIVMQTCCVRKDDFPLTMGVNAFRGFMNEFMNSRETYKPKAKRKKDKKRKVEEHTNYNGHVFQLTIINISTACEICQLFLLWPIERGLVCQNCRLTCHKKCYQKSLICSKISSAQIAGSTPHIPTDSKLFGVPLTNLCISESTKIPIKIEQLITKIEMLGLYSEGIYRKSGVNSKIKELKLKMSEKATASEIDYESYNVNVLANVLKSFLRDMPEPLLTFDRYDDFLRGADLQDTTVRVQTLLSLVKKIPPAHHSLLERLIFHLALVAQREKHNRMSASSLAIVFAPCVLRTHRLVPAQDSLNDIGRQTKCIETLITQKMLNVESTLADIDTLDTAAHTANTRLSSLRSSKVFSPEELTPRPSNLESETEEMLLEGHIQEIQKEKAILTSHLPNLVRATSDDDLLSTDLEGECGSLDDISTGKDNKEYQLPLEHRDTKDSMDSSFGSSSDFNGSSKRNLEHESSKDSSSSVKYFNINSPPGGGNRDSMALSYNLREQNIDYVVSPIFQDQDTRSRNNSCIQMRSPSSSQSQQTTYLGGTGTRWSTSHQNLAYSSMDGSSNSGGGNTTTAAVCCNVIESPKPIAVRSMSSGYQTNFIHGTTRSFTGGVVSGGGIGGSENVVSYNPGAFGSSTSNINNTSDKKSNKQNRSSKKKQGGGSVDEEPIMV